MKDHLELLSPKQIGHLIQLEAWWQTSYADEEDEAEYQKLKAFLKNEDGEQNG